MDYGTIMLIGDSITYGFDTKKLLPKINIINNGVPADSTLECYGRIKAEWFEQKIDKIFICIGTNDFALDRDDDFILEQIKNIHQKLASLSKESRIYFTSIFPTRDNDLRPNDRIINFNKKLYNNTEELGCNYFDIHEFFEDSEGKLKEIYTEDGLHLNNTAYQKWAQILTEFLSKEA